MPRRSVSEEESVVRGRQVWVRGDRKKGFRVNMGGKSKDRLTTVAEFFARS
jgi:hypothetical protein